MSESLRQSLDLSLFWEYRFILFKGLSMSVGVFACASLVAVAGGLFAALGRVSRWRALRWAATLHVEIARNAPDYIMVVWVHFVLPLLLGALIGRRLEFNPFVSAVVALGFVYSG
jgi:polar amino acid transport system permease protein